jgi:hypothetical protein
MGAIGNRSVMPVPRLPALRVLTSPEVVRVLDRIRFRLDDIDTQNSSDEHSEFTWFAREYPRCYRHHLNCADYRLRAISDRYHQILADLTPMVIENNATVQVSISDERVQKIYWDFESYLSEINIALDILARIAGTAYEEEMPPNFNRFCKKDGDAGILGVMKRARRQWVKGLKDYRDCFQHYTPVDTLLSLSLSQRRDGFEIRGKLPVNPNVREIIGFRFSRRVELFRYARKVHRNMSALDKAVAREFCRAFAQGDYPKRISNLFFVGRREQKTEQPQGQTV